MHAAACGKPEAAVRSVDSAAGVCHSSCLYVHLCRVQAHRHRSVAWRPLTLPPPEPTVSHCGCRVCFMMHEDGCNIGLFTASARAASAAAAVPRRRCHRGRRAGRRSVGRLRTAPRPPGPPRPLQTPPPPCVQPPASVSCFKSKRQQQPRAQPLHGAACGCPQHHQMPEAGAPLGIHP